MRMYDLIYKKREGEELTAEEIDWIITGYTAGDIPDYQISAWAMTVFFKGMNARETANLTDAVVNSGDQIDLSRISGVKVDKHSTGGVGDTTTLVLAPLVAAAGVPVPKMSGKGLGHTGGTIDKLESIPGFTCELEKEAFFKQVEEIGAAIVSQTGNLTPADKKLYALRDVTATVDSIPLIASSIMGKKIAGGADAIVLDVKTGSGAFMQKQEDARQLAELMVDIGSELGRKTIALLTDMSQPLGQAVGNALEVKEAIKTLKGSGPEDLKKLCLKLGSAMLVAGQYESDLVEAEKRLAGLIENGAAAAKFKEIVKAQGGNPEIVANPELLPQAQNIYELKAEQAGYIEAVTAREVGLVAMALGAGRAKKEDPIDPGVGIEVTVNKGDRVETGDLLARVHYNSAEKPEEEIKRLQNAYKISPEKPEELEFIIDLIE
ncbi:MAG: pyrimidine-nucleoside phosphorylase [Bacillota bacterium]